MVTKITNCQPMTGTSTVGKGTYMPLLKETNAILGRGEVYGILPSKKTFHPLLIAY